jgi:hypothetical protein
MTTAQIIEAVKLPSSICTCGIQAIEFFGDEENPQNIQFYMRVFQTSGELLKSTSPVGVMARTYDIPMACGLGCGKQSRILFSVHRPGKSNIEIGLSCLERVLATLSHQSKCASFSSKVRGDNIDKILQIAQKAKNTVFPKVK